jgi:RHS repeat-associated protein
MKSAGNMLSASRGTLSASGNNGSVLDTISSASVTQSWSLDTLGNMASVTTSGTAQSRSHNSRNQITALASATTPAYDSNGNMTTDQNGQQYVYDAWNRMMVAKNSSGSTINQYAYDGQNRQILNSSVYRYFSTLGQNLQSGTTAESLNQYQEVYNPFFIDGVMEVDTATATPGTYNQRVYGQWNANWDMTSITDTTGTAVERYEIDPYGKVIVLTGSWGSRSGSSYGWTYFHQGMRLDTATGLYQGRARDYNPSLCRWMQMDPAGYVDGLDLYEDESDNPDDRLDPLGLTNYSTFIGGGSVGTPGYGEIGGGGGGGGDGSGGGAYGGPAYLDWLYVQVYTSAGNWQMAELFYEKAVAAKYSPVAGLLPNAGGTGSQPGMMYAMGTICATPAAPGTPSTGGNYLWPSPAACSACKNATPENPYTGFNPYSPTKDIYSFTPAREMYDWGGNNPWGNQVRGCLTCLYRLGIVNQAAHDFCYATAARKHKLWALPGFVRAAGGVMFCHIHDFPFPRMDDP